MKNKVQIVALGISVIVIVVSLIVFSGSGDAPPPTFGNIDRVVIWGVDEPAMFENALGDYESQFRKKIEYVQKDPRSFDRDLLEAIAAGESPQAIIVGADWIAKNRDKIAPPQASIVNPTDVEGAFADLATGSLIERTQLEGRPEIKTVWGLPLWIDPLVLYWNKDLFNESLIAVPPATWHDFLAASNKIKELGAGGAVVHAGTALGRARNIPLHKEILTLLLLQQGTTLEQSFFTNLKEENQKALSVLRFYTDYGKPGTTAYTWHGGLTEPRDLFIEGKLGMMLDRYSYKKELAAKNPHRAFDVSPIPQTQGGKLAFIADVRAITVPKGSADHDAAWHLARFLISQPELKKIVADNPVVPARRDLIAPDSMPEILKKSVLNAKTVFEAHPKENAELLFEAIEAVANGQATPSEAITNAKTKRERLTNE